MKNKSAIIVNLLFWVSICLILIAFGIDRSKPIDWFKILVRYGFYGVINVSLFFINSLILIPDIIQKRQRTWLYLVLVVSLVFVAVLLKLGVAIMYPDYILERKRHDDIVTIGYLVYMGQAAFVSGFLVVVSSLLKFATDWSDAHP